MKVTLGVSNRHIHLTQEDYNKLFKEQLTKKNDLNQKGQFSSNQVITIKTLKNEINNVRIVGPFRDYTQVEISKTDAYLLGINPPVRSSGDILNSSPITLVGPCGEIKKEYGCIIPKRHIHISKYMLEKYGWDKSDTKKVIINKKNGGILFDVELSISDDTFFEMHINTDEANAFGLKTDDILDIID